MAGGHGGMVGLEVVLRCCCRVLVKQPAIGREPNRERERPIRHVLYR